MSISGYILIIEDDPTILELMTSYLETEGFIARGYLNTEDALAQADSIPPALILIDYGIGGQSGHSLHQVRAHEPWSSVPTVIVSGHANLSTLARDENADGWLAKPFEIDDLVAIVRRFMS